MSSSLTPTEPRGTLALKHTNVSNPSVVVKRSQQSLQPSLSASEDYYSLSSASSTHSDRLLNDTQNQSNLTITRYHTPPSRYRTPLQSRDNILRYVSQEEMRKTPMRGQGKRRQSPTGLEQRRGSDGGLDVAYPAVAYTGIREGSLRRKPVPNTVIRSRPLSEADMIRRSIARSSVAVDMDREPSPPTPGVDDTPYIRFALDQLTRDEEVRGSRNYLGSGWGAESSYPYLGPEPLTAQRAIPLEGSHEVPADWPLRNPQQIRPEEQQRQISTPDQPEFVEHERLQPRGLPPSAIWGQQQTVEARHDMSDEPPPRSPRRLIHNQTELDMIQSKPHTSSQRVQPNLYYSQEQSHELDTFVPLSASEAHQERLRSMPKILRPFSILLFLVFLFILIGLLVTSAVLTLTRQGLWDYENFGDSRYVIFQYLPTLMGTLLFLWLVQIMVAVYRLAPFIAVSSSSSIRERGAQLPLYPKGFVLPYFGHFRAGLPVIGIFMVIAWLQIFTVPLLASIFNVYFFSAPGHWRWVATQGIIWVVIFLYILLLLAVVLLVAWLRGRNTGLKWDPRSLSDVIVLLERSNALEGFEIEEEPAQLGYWKTLKRNEVFHTYGVVNKPARMYGVQDGRIREKAPLNARQRFAEVEHDSDVRNSREKMLPVRYSDDQEPTMRHRSALPWFLLPSAAALWIIIALVLLAAFLVVSYLPITTVSKGFSPAVPAPVNTAGFSSTNFLYSFLPSLLGMLCLLFWLNIDYTYRRLQPFTALAHADGALAEKSLLLTYVSDIFPAPTALANMHLRVAFISIITLVAAGLPILGGGVFWAQFYVSSQSIRISADMTAYYALTGFAALYALSYIAIFPSSATREACSLLPNNAMSFADIIELVNQSRIIDDIAFHSPRDRIDLVTRLLSAPPGLGANYEAGASKASLADSLRGFGKARQMAQNGVGSIQVPRYHLGRFIGRNGHESAGIDRLRR
ncbi:Hypothetical protein R9X50_00379800 [Acrodontium crateriforme]|uniref:Phosphoribosylaminoimidazole-succinocarboxamide synthase n=1 Tax=Acrodontium crateriforme TaxID=150365 RepID=A0AAQ3M3L4_9PEZI|nr:Hypothetical protein R9X50_00379800 [Acrodontium crateriforme]